MTRLQQHAQLIAQVDTTGLSKEQALKKTFKAHFEYVLKIPEHYKAVMLSEDKRFLEKTAMLNTETIKRLPAQKRLIELIEDGINQGEFKPVDPIVTAQIIWTSMFGLLIRVITEDFNDVTHIETMIDYYFDFILKGLVK